MIIVDRHTYDSSTNRLCLLPPNHWRLQDRFTNREQDIVTAKILLFSSILGIFVLNGCHYGNALKDETITVTDQLGRTVTVPRHMTRISALHHFGGKIVFALGQQNLLVEQSLYGKEAKALTAVDPKFAAMTKTQESHAINYEVLIGLRPQCAFVYASFNKSEMQQLENAGIAVIAVKGETIEESFAAVRLMAKVLDCEKRGQDYITDCTRLLSLVRERMKEIAPEKRLRAIFAGPKSIYTIATGEMLQSQMLDHAGAVNVGASLKGFWGDVSPEQLAAWNPDVIFVGSSLASTYGVEEILKNSQFQSIKAVKEQRVYFFPSNIGWWDYPAPQCVLGVLWAAKTLYPDRFADVDVLKTANDFYLKYMGHTFSSMGGRL
jgi:iron complex transport system substrate-binding protein